MKIYVHAFIFFVTLVFSQQLMANCWNDSDRKFNLSSQASDRWFGSNEKYRNL
jgi:hypothetical protein